MSTCLSCGRIKRVDLIFFPATCSRCDVVSLLCGACLKTREDTNTSDVVYFPIDVPPPPGQEDPIEIGINIVVCTACTKA
jgi:hypothetical protein